MRCSETVRTQLEEIVRCTWEENHAAIGRRSGSMQQHTGMTFQDADRRLRRSIDWGVTKEGSGE